MRSDREHGRAHLPPRQEALGADHEVSYGNMLMALEGFLERKVFESNGNLADGSFVHGSEGVIESLEAFSRALLPARLASALRLQHRRNHVGHPALQRELSSRLLVCGAPHLIHGLSEVGRAEGWLRLASTRLAKVTPARGWPLVLP